MIELLQRAVLNELNRQLVVPSGFAKILGYTRTNCSPVREIEPRLQPIRETILRVTAKAKNYCRAPTDEGALQGERNCR